ncbi:MAG: hypothetical protein LBK56_06470 [Gracilibacteraceae bacterium]|jgi:predicted amidohydrolase|nr:hypothetical protein [Gracilibacteraceae bacterium]
MKADIIIRNGVIVDPARAGQTTKDLVIAGKLIAADSADGWEAKETVDASGCFVTPGLTDAHVHVFDTGSELGVKADCLPPMGVTSAVDFGSAGYVNFRGFMRECVERSDVRVYSFVNVSPVGPVSLQRPEDVSPDGFSRRKLAELKEKYPGRLLGLKLRLGRETAGDSGLETLQAALKLSAELHWPLAVHVSNSPVPVRKIAALLREGDVFAHVYQDRGGDSILDGAGSVYPEILEARKRGVIFDVGHGWLNFSIETAQRSLNQGFGPDLLGTDMSAVVAYRRGVFGLPHIMSKFMALGFSLADLVSLCTVKPAALLTLMGSAPSLKPGSAANIAVFRLETRPVVFTDYHGASLGGNVLLTPQLTVIDGKIVWRQFGFDV